ncbi:MAG: hypothetical protein CSA07_00950 [Bacteroidia bacterium]|nr:MAG: hypothetical protein CSA07_00950 [Bacteroidia bacterium]
MNREIILVAVVAEGNAIGRGNGLLAHLPEDLAHFKALTMGGHMVMGRRTYESIGRPLPGRTSVVMSRTHRLEALPRLVQVSSWEEALRVCPADAPVYVVGGAQIYALAMPRATRLVITRLHSAFPDADAFFPEWQAAEWRLAEQSPRMASRVGLEYTIEEYIRK